MDTTVKQEIEKLGRAWTEFKQTNDKRLAEIEASGTARGETEEKLRKLDAAIEKAEEAKAKSERSLADVEQLLAAAKTGDPATEPDGLPAEYKQALYGPDGYIRHGRDAEVKAFSSLIGPDGGYTVGFERDPTFVELFTRSSPVRELAQVDRIGAASLKVSREANLMASGGWVGESQARPETGTPTLEEAEIFAREQYCFPFAPTTFLEDTVVDVEGWLSRQAARRFSVQEATAFVSGDGVKKPRGFTTYPATNPGNGAFVAQVSTLTNDTFVADDLIRLQDDLPEPYQANSTWLMHRLIWSTVRRFKSESNQYILQPGLQPGEPATLLGRPVRKAEDMASTVADQALIAVLADWTEFYRIVDRVGISVVRDALTAKPNVGFYMRRRVGGDVVNFDAGRILKVQ